MSLPDAVARDAAEFRVPASVQVDSAAEPSRDLTVAAIASWHSLAWLVFANGVGVLIALLLLAPGLNAVLGEWSYGRWMPVHINLQLYGWCSLPLVGFLFRVYGSDRKPIAAWCRPVLWVWSSALAVGALSTITGHSSGKLFLDWTGYSRVLFPSALVALWILLAVSLAHGWGRLTAKARGAKLVGLCLLLAVPVLIYIAADPNLYPPINPDSGGPTGASQLESVLIIIAILLLLPFGLTTRKDGYAAGTRAAWTRVAWIVFAVEFLLCFGLGRADVSHHRPVQYISLASLLVWLPLMPAYYGAFEWHANTRRWRIAFLCWWSVLVPTGWCLFLPGVLDHFKFTDGLVGHSLLAMGGFVSSLLIFVMVQMLGEDGWILNGSWAFYLWQGSVLIYVLLMFVAGWREGFDPAFTMARGTERNTIYLLRLILGTLMFVASAYWLMDASKLLREPARQRAA